MMLMSLLICRNSLVVSCSFYHVMLCRSADTRDIRTVAQGPQTTSQDIPVHSFISEHFYLTYFLTFSVDLAIANVI